MNASGDDCNYVVLHLDKRSLVQWRIMDRPTSFVWIIIFLKGPSECGGGEIFKLVRWMKNLYQSTWDHEILYCDKSSKDKQLLVMQLLRKPKNTNMAGDWKFKYIFYFMERTYEPLYLLGKWRFVQRKIKDIPTSFIWITIFIDGAFEYGGGSTFWGYVATNAEPLCVDFCNFVQFHTFVSYLNCCC
jgi:hypothetical protein